MDIWTFLKVMEHKNLVRNFWIKVWGLRGLNNFFKKAAGNWHDGRMKRQHWKHTEFFCLSILWYSYTNCIS